MITNSDCDISYNHQRQKFAIITRLIRYLIQSQILHEFYQLTNLRDLLHVCIYAYTVQQK